MTTPLARALAKINEPKEIAEILEAANGQGRHTSRSDCAQDGLTLTELYRRFLSRRMNRSPATIAQYRRTIPTFTEFLGDQGISKPSELTVNVVDDYVDNLQSEYERDATIHTYTKNVRTWLRWLNKRGLCDQSTFQILGKEELGLSPKARDEALSGPVAERILQQLRKRRRGTAAHALMEVLWNAGPRIGGIHSLDLNDLDLEMDELRFRHRPETGTRLKNGDESGQTNGDGERNITIREEAIEALQLYIATNRTSVTDEYGREPLFTTNHGRPAKSTLRRWIYETTSCSWAPNKRDEVTCDGHCDSDSNVCPSSYYPHAIRRGAIVHHLKGGLRPDLASERFDVSVRIIRKHYDPRTKRERKEDRAQSVRSSWSVDIPNTSK